MKSCRILSYFCLCSVLAATLTACGPQKKEEWNSYYYGTERRSTAGIYDDKRYPADNDDSYVMPSGVWSDDQTPQHPKWDKVR